MFYVRKGDRMKLSRRLYVIKPLASLGRLSSVLKRLLKCFCGLLVVGMSNGLCVFCASVCTSYFGVGARRCLCMKTIGVLYEVL